MTSSTSKLFQPIKAGNMTLLNRVVMAPLTRKRADDEHIPISSMVARYYSDRASVPGTLIISEATSISPAEEGQANIPGITTPAEIAAWKPIYDAVHARKSFIFQQLWGLGRASEPEHLASRGFPYTSSSAVALPDSDIVPVALTDEEIRGKIADFARAAKNAVDAGADGVEIHGAHGYLIDQFTKDSVNTRTDRWGGSVENRARFLLEVVAAVVAAIGAPRVGLRLSPFATYLGAVSSDPEAQYRYIVRELKKADYDLAYLSLVEPLETPASVGVAAPEANARSLDFLLEEWNNRSLVVVAGGYLPDTAAWAVDERYKNWNVAVAFGRHFIANPDLVYRIKHGLGLNRYNRATFYTPKIETGYNDYPFSAEYTASATAMAA